MALSGRVEAGGAESTKLVTLRFPASLTYRHVAIDLITALVGEVTHADRDFRNQLVTAFGEAFNNIVIHGYRDRGTGMIDIEAEMSATQMILRLIDSGREVAFKDVEPPDLDAMPESGMGVFMIYSLVDDVLYSAGPPNVLSLVKRTNTVEGAR